MKWREKIRWRVRTRERKVERVRDGGDRKLGESESERKRVYESERDERAGSRKEAESGGG